MANPYQKQPQRAFWRLAVAERRAANFVGIWSPKFAMGPDDPVATFGSCFAQNIGAALRDRAFKWLITEPPPLGMNSSSARQFRYGVFTCRTGNIYTCSLLRQWARWAVEDVDPPDETWGGGNRWIDPFRPRIEPDDFVSIDELIRSRKVAITAFRQAIAEARYFVFTLGLTEGWRNRSGGFEYPLCPGVAGGTFDGEIHEPFNHDAAEAHDELLGAIRIMRSINSDLGFLLTVSPVPLTATASRAHVLAATTYSKSVLRAAAGKLAREHDFVDYFPSYELIASPVLGGRYYKDNQRGVRAEGVAFVMDHFFAALGQEDDCVSPRSRPEECVPAKTLDELCDEELLNVFGGEA